VTDQDRHEPAEQRSEPETAAGDGAAATALSLGQRPEVLVGAAFGGAFIVARVLKRLFD
jgi:hypothetical protein